MSVEPAPKPFKHSPYEYVQKIKCIWLYDMRQLITDRIDWLSSLIRNEASSDGLDEMANEDFIYERFVDNRDSGMQIANWQVLKYFILFMERKVLYEMIGEWNYTVHDVEMYRYFRTGAMDCKRKYIVCTTEKDYTLEMFMSPTHVKWGLPYFWYASPDPSGSLPIDSNYFDLFVSRFKQLNDIIKHSTKCVTPEYDSKCDFFSDAHIYNTPRWLSVDMMFSTMDETINNMHYSDETALSLEETGMVNKFVKLCNEDKEYAEQHKKLMDIVNKKFQEFCAANKESMVLKKGLNNFLIFKWAFIYSAGRSATNI